MSTDDREQNPYAAPKETEKTVKRTKKKKPVIVEDDNDSIEEIVRSFQRTRSWISFFGVLCYIGAVLLVIGGFGVVFAARTVKSGPLASIGPLMLILYLILGVIYVVFGARLLRYRDAINEVIRTDGKLENIAAAIEYQAQFWTLAGQFTIAVFVLYGFGAMLGVLSAASLR